MEVLDLSHQFWNHSKVCIQALKSKNFINIYAGKVTHINIYYIYLFPSWLSRFSIMILVHASNVTRFFFSISTWDEWTLVVNFYLFFFLPFNFFFFFFMNSHWRQKMNRARPLTKSGKPNTKCNKQSKS